MRQLLFFDLPTETPADRKAYQKFHKFLIQEGFIMMQFSVYSKLSLNDTQAKTVLRRVEGNKPPRGNVMMLKVTEYQFAHMAYILGEKDCSIANSDERVVFFGKQEKKNG